MASHTLRRQLITDETLKLSGLEAVVPSSLVEGINFKQCHRYMAAPSTIDHPTQDFLINCMKCLKNGK